MRDEDVLDGDVKFEVPDLRWERFPVVEDVGGAHVRAEGARLGARGGGDDDWEAQEMASDLAGNAADAAGAVDDEDGGVFVLFDAHVFN